MLDGRPSWSLKIALKSSTVSETNRTEIRPVARSGRRNESGEARQGFDGPGGIGDLHAGDRGTVKDFSSDGHVVVRWENGGEGMIDPVATPFRPVSA